MAMSSAKMAKNFWAAAGIFSTTTGMFMWPRSPVMREAPNRLAQANR